MVSLFMDKSDSQLNNRDFQLMSDEELVLFLREGGHPESSDAAVEYLCGKYKSLVRNLAKPYYLPDGNTDDLIQEGMIGLFKAIRDYDPGKKAAFHTFATLCIRRQLDTAVKTSGREKNQALNNAISIYTRIAGAGEDGSGGKLADIIGAEGSLVETSFDGMAGDSRSPEDRIIEEENVRSLVQEITEILSPLESEVLNLYLDGNDYTAIAKILGRDEKSTDNALQRGRMKVRKILKERNQRRV
jgi:RNA polymerase sporulation-specific sigma factor